MISLAISITSISAQSNYEIPSWVKGIASFWAEENISDQEFGESLSFLIDNEIIKVPKIQELQNELSQLKAENSELRTKLNLPNSIPKQSTNPNSPSTSTTITVQTDDNNYDEGDIIVISGNVNTVIGDAPVLVQIVQEGAIVETAQVIVAQDGTFTKTIIAEGGVWKNEGEYTVRVFYQEHMAESKFNFTSKSAIVTTSNFEVDARNHGVFDVEYTIQGGTIQNIVFDSNLYGLIITLNSVDDGVVTFELHENLIKAEKQNGNYDTFIVLIDGIEVSYQELSSSSKYRKISVNFEQGDSEIMIIGTFVYTPNQSTSTSTSNQNTSQKCDSSYPDVCIPPYPPDLDCGEISFKNFRVIGSDPHGFDRDNDGIGCES
jgi:hypothetical protein